MLFNSPAFLFFFLPLTLAGYWLACQRPRVAMAWLLVASIVFYAYWDIRFLPVLLASILVNRLFGGLISDASAPMRRVWLVVGVSLNIVVLVYFKYSNFGLQVLTDWTGWTPAWTEVVLPIGISFITFQKIAFLVDAYRGDSVSRDTVAFGVFVTFFPQLIAGPIVHHHEIIPQLGKHGKDRWSDLAAGLTLVAIGLFKKVALADRVAPYSTSMFEMAATGSPPAILDAWLGVLAYALQIYLDFSAYSDMALGLARMFGIDLPINFASPYKARSVIDFWRRWHITLSRFLRDYLYIAMGGNRKGPIRQKLNLLVTMTLGGAWHGANWTFMVWGVMHGVFLLINHAWARTGVSKSLATKRYWQPVAGTLTFLSVIVAWVPFRADSLGTTWLIWKSMAGAAAWTMPDSQFKPGVVLAMAVILLGCVTFPNAYEIMAKASVGTSSPGYSATRIDADRLVANQRWTFRVNRWWLLITVLLLLIAILRLNDVSEFIYFQF